jgi:glycosyltransferase involved in cell wall biosynthesis
MRVALVHDYLVQHGGAERVLEAFTEIYPDAPIYTIVYDQQAMGDLFAHRDIRTSFLQRIPWARRNHRLFPLLMPLAIEQFDFSSFDIVLSDSASYAKGVITRPETLHICYLHTPTRYAWDDSQKYAQDFGFSSWVKWLIPLFVSPVRLWDRAAARRPDRLIANSSFVRKRIAKYYRREASVIHPPVDTRHFTLAPAGSGQGYFLIVGRLLAYKRHDIAILACNRLGLPLKIIGRGPELERLRSIAGPTIEFLDRVDDADLPRYYAECRAFIFPQEEDFGIVAIEALAAGRPLIAYRGGDIVEHLEEDRMGVFFDEQTPEAVIEAIERFSDKTFQPEYIREQVLGFDREIFKKNISEAVDQAWREHQKRSLMHLSSRT